MTKRDKNKYKRSNHKAYNKIVPKIEQTNIKLEQDQIKSVSTLQKPISKKQTNKLIKKQAINHKELAIKNIDRQNGDTLQQNADKLQHNVDRLQKKDENIVQKKDNKKTKRARLIIRNLVYDINEKLLRKLMSPYGEIKQIQIPKHPDKNIGKGYAFIQYVNKNMSLKAIKKLNQTTYKGRTIILDLAVAKQKFLSQQLVQSQKQAPNQNKQQELEDDSNQQQIKIQQNMEDQDSKIEQQLNNQKQQQLQEQSQEQENGEQDYGDQIFVRNLPLSLTEQELNNYFKKFGKVIFAKLVMNQQTNKSKGTAFIKFKDHEVAQKLIEYSRSYEMYMMKKIKFFQVDPAINLQMDGIIMKIFPVQSRKSIQTKLKDRLTENGKPQQKKKPLKKIKKIEDLIKTDPYDKRKLKLAIEGFWKAQEGMNQKEYQKFKNHEKQKIEKLKNPNHSISDTRIILKFLDKSISEEDLRNVCRDFLAQRNIQFSQLTYCKLMLDHNRQKSAGYAFIQFRKHEISKQFIQHIIKHRELIMRNRFVIEFAIQDSKVLLKLKNKSRKGQRPQKKQAKNRDQQRKPKKFNKKISKINNRVKQTHSKRKIKSK